MNGIPTELSKMLPKTGERDVRNLRRGNLSVWKAPAIGRSGVREYKMQGRSGKMAYFPMFVDLAGKHVLVVGGGVIAC